MICSSLGQNIKPRFMVGERVICITPSAKLHTGNEYTVTRVYKHYNGKYIVDVCSDQYLYDTRFVPAKEYNVQRILKEIDDNDRGNN